MANTSADAVASMFGGGLSTLAALSSFANSGANSANTANAIQNGFANALSNHKPPVLNGTQLANSINAGFTGNNTGTTGGSASFTGQMKNLIDAAYTIVNRIETTNTLLQKMIDISSGKVQQNDINKIAATNNRISMAMSRTAMGRLAVAVMSKQLGRSMGQMDYRMQGALDSGVTSNKELISAKLLSSLPLVGKMFNNMKDITDKVLRAKDVFTNETNISITKLIPTKLEAIGQYTQQVYQVLNKSIYSELRIQTQALISINDSINLAIISNNNALNRNRRRRDDQGGPATNLMDRLSLVGMTNEMEALQEKARIEQAKNMGQLILLEREQMDLQTRDSKISEKLLLSSDKILNANVKTSMLLGNFITKFPNLLTRFINTAIKTAMFAGLFRNIFKMFGADRVAENISVRGAVGFIGAAGRFVNEVFTKVMESDTGKAIKKFVSEKLQFVKEKTIELVTYGINKMIEMYATFVLLPKLVREKLPLVGAKLSTGISSLLTTTTDTIEVTNKSMLGYANRWGKLMLVKTGGLFSTIGGVLGKVAIGIGKAANIAGLAYIVITGLKNIVGGAFNAWRSARLSESEINSMGIGEQVTLFIKDIFKAFSATVVNSVQFIWENIGPIIEGMFMGIFETIVDGIKSSINWILSKFNLGWEDKDERFGARLREESKFHLEQSEKTADIIETSNQNVQEETKSLKDSLVSTLGDIKEVLVKGFSYVSKIFDFFKPKTLGTLSGGFLGHMSLLYQKLLPEKEAAEFAKTRADSIDSIIKATNEKVFTVAPHLKDTIKLDALGRVIGGDQTAFESAIQNLSYSDRNAYYRSLGESQVYNPIKMLDEANDGIAKALNDKDVRMNQLLAQIEQHTKDGTELARQSVWLTRKEIAIAKGEVFDPTKDEMYTAPGKAHRLEGLHYNFTRSDDQIYKDALTGTDVFKDLSKKQVLTETKLSGGSGREITIEHYKSMEDAINEHFEQYSKTEGHDKTLDIIRNNIFNKIKVNGENGANFGQYISAFNAPDGSINDAGSLARYYNLMGGDMISFYNLFRNTLRKEGISDDIYYNNLSKLDTGSPDKLFASLFIEKLANGANNLNPYRNVYNTMLGNSASSQYVDFKKTMDAYISELAFSYATLINKYLSIDDNNSTIIAAKSQDEVNNSVKAFIDSLKLVPFSSSKATIDNYIKTYGNSAPSQEGDDPNYGDWRSFSPTTKFGNWRDSIYQASLVTGLDPELISAIIKQESGGRIDAQSRAGAYGLMQLMAAAETDGNKFLGKTPGTLSRTIPEENILLGAAYMARMINSHGSIIDGLRAYNWGPGNFRKWKSSGGNLSSVPVEAREYPGRVLRYYGGRYFTDPTTPINRDIHLIQRIKAMSEAGLLSGNDATVANILSAPPDTATTTPGGSDHRARAKQYLMFSGTTLDKFMSLNPLLREPFLRYGEEMYKTYNRKVVVTSTYRSLADQTRLWNNRKNNPNLVGKPNPYNKHNLGLAIDINSKDGYSINDHLLNKYGMVRPFGAKDPVHVEMREWANIRGTELVKRYGDYPRKIGASNPVNTGAIPEVTYSSGSGSSYGSSTGGSGSYAAATSGAPVSLSSLLNQKMVNAGLNLNVSDGYLNSMQLLGLMGDDRYYGDAEPINYTGLTAGIRNTTFDNELSKIKLTSISNAQMTKISGSTSELESQLAKVMALLAKKTIENNNLMKQMINSSNVNNIVTVNSSNTTNSSNNVSNGAGRGNSAANSDLSASFYGGNDMGLRALYI